MVGGARDGAATTRRGSTTLIGKELVSIFSNFIQFNPSKEYFPRFKNNRYTRLDGDMEYFKTNYYMR